MVRRLLFVLVAAATVAVLAVAGQHEVTAGPLPTPGPPADAVPMYVRWVYDGDTVQLQNVAPNQLVTTQAKINVRLIGVDTPELKPEPQCFGPEAAEFLRSLLPVDSTVLAAPDKDTWDDYRRRLFYLWTPDGRFVDYELVAGGYAEAIRVWPNVAHFELLLDAQEEAQAAGRGRWDAC